MQRFEFIGKVIETLENLAETKPYIAGFDYDISGDEEFFSINVRIRFSSTDNVSTFCCGFGSGGYYIDNFETDSDIILKLIQNPR